MRIALLTPSITTGDAVSNDVLGMSHVLRDRGDVRIFAEGWSLDMARVYPAAKVRTFLKSHDDILIYHYSRGWEPGLELLRQLNCRKVIKYHNVTPPEFAVRYNSGYAAMCREGRRQLTAIAQSDCDLFLSASAYNMRELIAEGASAAKSFVVPPFHHVDRLNSVKPDAAVLQRYQNGHVNVCTVGRVAPNKGHPDLIAAFAAYHHDYNPESKLIIVGKQETRLAKYLAVLRAMTRRLKLEHAVIFAGEVSESALRAYYNIADVFVTTSEHEGFCVPLVEAMAMRVPIVAYASSAIPETVGNAGIVWEQRQPTLLAESLNSIATNKQLGKALAATGWRRYQQQFTSQCIERQFLATISRLL